MQIKAATETLATFAPDIGDNIEKYEAGKTAFVVEYRPMSGRDLNKAKSAVFKKLGGLRSKRIAAYSEEMQAYVLREHVVTVSGLTVTGAAGGDIVPRTGAELLDCLPKIPGGLADMIGAQIVAEVQGLMPDEESDLGNSEPRSDSSSGPPRTSGVGSAENAPMTRALTPPTPKTPDDSTRVTSSGPPVDAIEILGPSSTTGIPS